MKISVITVFAILIVSIVCQIPYGSNSRDEIPDHYPAFKDNKKDEPSPPEQETTITNEKEGQEVCNMSLDSNSEACKALNNVEGTNDKLEDENPNESEISRHSSNVEEIPTPDYLEYEQYRHPESSQGDEDDQTPEEEQSLSQPQASEKPEAISQEPVDAPVIEEPLVEEPAIAPEEVNPSDLPPYLRQTQAPRVDASPEPVVDNSDLPPYQSQSEDSDAGEYVESDQQGYTDDYGYYGHQHQYGEYDPDHQHHNYQDNSYQNEYGYGYENEDEHEEWQDTHPDHNYGQEYDAPSEPEPRQPAMTTQYDAYGQGSSSGSQDVFEEAEVVDSEFNGEMPQPVGFFAEVETIGMLMKYEKVLDSFKQLAFNSAEYLEKELHVPYPFNYVVVVLSGIVSIYLTRILTPLLCPKKKKEQLCFNTIDSVDMSKLMKTLEKIEKQGGVGGAQLQFSDPGKVSMSDHKPHPAIDHSDELSYLREQVASLKSELNIMAQKQDQTYKMIENIATSQNDLETNVYKAIMKIYNKIDEKKASPSNEGHKSSRSRDLSPISFQHRSNLP